MNPGLFVKLRPTGPWRIGPDSGARNRVDVIYHSDSVFAAVTSAMARLGCLEEWLDQTARRAQPQPANAGPAGGPGPSPAVCFSSCFPFLDEIGFVVPPRSAWPPSAPALLAARVRWKSARFVPLGIVPAILAGQTLDEHQWAIDGPSACLVPAGRPGPFRMDVRWNAAVDRLTGAADRHLTACIEFRPGAGLWTVVSFADAGARARWSDRIKAAFRWLADSGFGGERSRGWGRAEAPEFLEGTLPEMILGIGEAKAGMGDEGLGIGEPVVAASAPDVTIEPPVNEPEETAPVPPVEELETEAGEAHVTSGPDVLPMPPLGEPEEPAPVPPIEEPVEPPPPDLDPELPGEPAPEPEPSPAAPEAELPATEAETPVEDVPAPESPSPNPQSPTPEPQAAEAETTPEPLRAPEPPIRGPRSPIPGYWLLSLFSPGPQDAVDWSRGSYAAITRGGRVESPARSGELKKQVQMVAEGSVLYAAAPPRGAAPDVAPDGFPHPVFRAGFALAIPLPSPVGAAPRPEGASL